MFNIKERKESLTKTVNLKKNIGKNQKTIYYYKKQWKLLTV